jgi:hypothetical protein
VVLEVHCEVGVVSSKQAANHPWLATCGRTYIVKLVK